MTYLSACNCQGLFSYRPVAPKLGIPLRRLARGGLMATLLLLGSAVVVSSWMPRGIQPVAQQTELYLQTTGDDAQVRQDLSDSISPSTVLGGSLR
jgi:hypothetical protein